MFMYLIFGMRCFPSLSTDYPRPVHHPEIEDRAFKAAGASAGRFHFALSFRISSGRGNPDNGRQGLSY